jgi:hypothetical protein
MRRSIVRYAASGLVIASVFAIAAVFLWAGDDAPEAGAQIPSTSSDAPGVSATSYQVVPIDDAAFSLNINIEQQASPDDVQAAYAVVQSRSRRYRQP